MPERKKFQCGICGKLVSSANIIKHQTTKKCKKYNDKTTGKPPIHMPAARSAAAPVEKNKLIEINLKGEYDKMTETLNPKKKETKEKAYKCAGCGCEFNHFAEGRTCPDCGAEL